MIRKKILLTSISILSIGILSIGNANAYDIVTGNDYANIGAYNINKDDFQKDNIIQRNGNFTNINTPKPKGKVDINVLGAKRTIELNLTDEQRQQKRKRYFNIQKRKKAQRLEEQKQANLIAEQKKAQVMAEKSKKEAEALEKQKKLAQEKAALDFQEYNSSAYGYNANSNGVPSTPPKGLPIQRY